MRRSYVCAPSALSLRWSLRADVFAAFLDALRYPGSYDLFEQEGELFIVPVDEDADPVFPCSIPVPCHVSHRAGF